MTFEFVLTCKTANAFIEHTYKTSGHYLKLIFNSASFRIELGSLFIIHKMNLSTVIPIQSTYIFKRPTFKFYSVGKGKMLLKPK